VLGIAMVIEPRPGAGNELNPSPPGLLEALEQRRYAFLETFAHDLNNTLTPLLSAAQMLQRHGAKKPDVVEWAGTAIERQVRQVSSTVRDLLDLARAARGKLEVSHTTLDLKPVLESAIESCRPLADDRHQTLSVDLPSVELRVSGDAARLEQAIQQLLCNAIAFTPVGGRIELAAECASDQVVIRVRDTGSGLAADTLATLFDPFAQPDEPGFRKTRGMGVGLALAHRLIALHGGTLHAVSEGLARGTEFVASLPAVP
jgi:signal transduction histidine kinase